MSEHAELNRKMAHYIAQNQALHKEAQDVLEGRIFTELQIAEKRSEIVAKVQLERELAEKDKRIKELEDCFKNSKDCLDAIHAVANLSKSLQDGESLAKWVKRMCGYEQKVKELEGIIIDYQQGMLKRGDE